MKLSPRNSSSLGFTFVEVFAAMVFLAILVPAVLEGLSVATRASLTAERGTVAAELAENKLNEMLVGNAWASGTATNGDFGAEWPNYRWEMNQTSWSADNVNTMTQLEMQVFYPVQGAEHSVTLDTLVTTGSLGSSGTSGGQSTL